MKNLWDERYSQPEYIYGIAPNEFFAEKLSELEKGDLLLPAEGEGRNAVFAAINGWNVTAFDFSAEGKKKAQELASQNKVDIDYKILAAANYRSASKFEAIALIYAHFNSKDRALLFPQLQKSIADGGSLIVEVFSKKQLGRSSGGPKDPDLLYSLEEVKESFPNFKFSILEEVAVPLDEGPYHQGEGMVIRAVGMKV